MQPSIHCDVIPQPGYGLTRTESRVLAGENNVLASLIRQDPAGFIPFISFRGQVEITTPLSLGKFQEIVMTYESKRFEVAKRIVRSLLKNLNYSELYEDFLQEGITEEEFKLESEKFAVEPRKLDPRQLHFEAMVAFDLSGGDSIDADQLSMMLETDPIETDSIIRGREHPIATAR